MENLGTELTQNASEEESGERDGGVQGKLGKHESMFSAPVPHVWMQSFPFIEEGSDPNGELEDASEKDDDAADLDGLQFVA